MGRYPSKITITKDELMKHWDCLLKVDFGAANFRGEQTKTEYSLWCLKHETVVGNTITVIASTE